VRPQSDYLKERIRYIPLDAFPFHAVRHPRRFSSPTHQVAVRYIDRARGKGVFSNASFQLGDTVFIEIPLVSHLHVSLTVLHMPPMQLTTTMVD